MDKRSDERRVLVVEDEPHIRELVALHLRLEGWTPELVDNGVTALGRRESEPSLNGPSAFSGSAMAAASPLAAPRSFESAHAPSNRWAF